MKAQYFMKNIILIRLYHIKKHTYILKDEN